MLFVTKTKMSFFILAKKNGLKDAVYSNTACDVSCKPIEIFGKKVVPSTTKYGFMTHEKNC